MGGGMIDIARISDPRLRTIAEKVLAGAPVDAEDARAMLGTVAVMDLAMIANHVREALHGRRAYYGVNMNLNYTNICELRCPLCAFSCDEGDAGAYLMPLELIEARVRDAVRGGIDEVHIVGGLNPSPDFAYYEEMIRRIKGVKPDLFVVAFTAVEYDYFARRSGLPLREVMKRLVAAGVDALPGGGAEIFAHEKRSVIAPRKIPAERWLEVMETAHSMGLRTNVTMLYNHIEDREDIVDHLSRVRTLQDRTGGFKTFVPLPYHDENTAVRARRAEPTGFDEVRIFATARIFLHNVPHLKALWMYLGDKMAQVLLDCGVDDFGATYHHERVVHAAGARTPDAGSEEHLVRLIRDAGRAPVRSNAGYRNTTLEE